MRVVLQVCHGERERRLSTVSAGAYGIDAAAHRGVLGVGAMTVAVLACGVDYPYPAGHEELFANIAAQGVVASEWPPGRSPARLRFLVRNRVIAALTCGTVVVEAGGRSGALNTARHAAELGGPLMAVPGPVTSAQSAGSHRIIRDWGGTCVTCAADVVEMVSPIGVPGARPSAGSRPWAGPGAPPSGRLESIAACVISPSRNARYAMLAAAARPGLAVLAGHGSPVQAMAFSPGGRLLAVIDNDHSLRLWDVATRQPLGAPLTGAVNSVAFSPDGTLLAAGHRPGNTARPTPPRHRPSSASSRCRPVNKAISRAAPASPPPPR